MPRAKPTGGVCSYCRSESSKAAAAKHLATCAARRAATEAADGAEWVHLYDYGDTSETRVKAVGVREGKPTTKQPMVLLVRNVEPATPCQVCREPARWYCQECAVEEHKPGMLCDAHRKKHPHKDYGGPIALVNSPRLGMCGYTGPAKPPY